MDFFGFFLLAAIVPGAAAVTIELLARFWIRHGHSYAWTPGHRLEMNIDPLLKIDGQTTARIQINSRGERGGGGFGQPGAFEILATGGSAVECYLLDQPNTWTAVLERKLSLPKHLHVLKSQRVHVGNCGKAGVDSYRLDMMLKHLAGNYKNKVDVILIMAGASDVLNWMAAGAPDAWRGNGDEPLGDFLAVHSDWTFGWKPRTLAVAELYRRVRAKRPVVRNQAGKTLLKARRYRQQAAVFHQKTPDAAVVFERFERYMASAIATASSFSRHVIVISQPCFSRDAYSPEDEMNFWGGAVGDPFKGEVSTFFSARVIADLMTQLTVQTKLVAQKAGVPCLDLSSGVIPNDRSHYYDQFHFTPKGAAVAGSIAAEMILDVAGLNGGGGRVGHPAGQLSVAR